MSNPSTSHQSWRTVSRGLTAVFFVFAGINHFIKPGFYRSIVPPKFPAPGLLVSISGLCEIAGGLGLIIRPIRNAAAWGLVALLIAVFPANIYMARHPDDIPDLHIAHWLLWLRLPLQVVLIFWVQLISRASSSL